MSARILILLPSTFEAEAVFKNYGASHNCKLGGSCNFTTLAGTECKALVCGIGCEKSAERVLKAIENFCPSDIILCGFAGACTPDLACGDFVCESESESIEKVLHKQKIQRGKIAFSNVVADTQAKEKLASEGFDAVEMESEIFKNAIGADGDEFRPNFTHIRCISDDATTDMPAEFLDSMLNRETGAINVSIPVIIKLIFKSPKIVLSLIKFSKNAASAKSIYAQKLTQIFSSL